MYILYTYHRQQINQIQKIWIEDQSNAPSFEIKQKQRIGIKYAEEDKKLPWRFYIKNNKFVSVK